MREKREALSRVLQASFSCTSARIENKKKVNLCIVTSDSKRDLILYNRSELVFFFTRKGIASNFIAWMSKY